MKYSRNTLIRAVTLSLLLATLITLPASAQTDTSSTVTQTEYNDDGFNWGWLGLLGLLGLMPRRADEDHVVSDTSRRT